MTKNPIVYWRTAAAALAVIILAGTVIVVYDRTYKNRQAIEKGCVLLNNAIIRSSQAPPSPAQKILVEAILAQSPKDTILKYQAASHVRPASLITLVNCEAISKHPDDIHPVPVQSQPTP